jgi:hypothetical protein
MAVVAPVYSPLCDFDKATYEKYLFTLNSYLLTKNGASVRGNGVGEWAGVFDCFMGPNQFAGRRFTGNTGRDPCVNSSRVCEVEPSCVGSERRSTCVGSERVGGSGLVVDGDRGVAGRDAGAGAVRVCADDRAVGGAAAAPSSPGTSTGVVRGPNWERNQVWKKARREQRARRRRSSVAAPAVAVEVPVVSAVEKEVKPPRWNRGYFSDMPDDVQKKLRETRAKLLIAENERKLREEEQRVKYLDSPMALVESAMRAVAMAEKAAKKVNDSKVMGWAQTVATSYAESISGTSGSLPKSGLKSCSVPSVSAPLSSSASQADPRARVGLRSGSKVCSTQATSVSVSVSSSASQVDQKYSLQRMPAGKQELVAMKYGLIASEELPAMRAWYGKRIDEKFLFDKKKFDRVITRKIEEEIAYVL